MKLLHYITPLKEQFLANVKYIDGREKVFDYIIGMYKTDNSKTKLIGIENKEIVTLNNNEFTNIVFTSIKKEVE
jgi:hypothetical protein